MEALTLPRLAGSRGAARTLIERQLPDKIIGAEVTVDCRDLKSAPASYADEVVRLLLVERQAARLVLKHSTPEFETYIRRSADAHGVATRVCGGRAQAS